MIRRGAVFRAAPPAVLPPWGAAVPPERRRAEGTGLGGSGPEKEGSPIAVFTRTANAGGILELDGVRLLLDGVSLPCLNYQVTPPSLEEALRATDLDAMLFTHSHADHFSSAFVEAWGRRRGRNLPLAGPADVAAALPGWAVEEGPLWVGAVSVLPVVCRHMGLQYRSDPHRAYCISGTARCLFLGDASPSEFLVPREPVQILFAPYPYASSRGGWRAVQALDPEVLVVTHLPAAEEDPEGICARTEDFLRSVQDRPVYCPAMGERLVL